MTFSIGGVLVISSSIALIFLNDNNGKDIIYPIAVIVGVAQAFTLNTGITMISEVIGIRGSSGAFVFGVYSFLDKLTNGIVLFLITNSN